MMIYFFVSDDKDKPLWIVHETFNLLGWTNVGLLNEQPLSACFFFLVEICCLFADYLQFFPSVLLCLYVVLNLNNVSGVAFVLSGHVSFIGIRQAIGKSSNDKRSCLIDREEREDKVEVEVFEAKIEDASSLGVLSAYYDFFSFCEQSFIVNL